MMLGLKQATDQESFVRVDEVGAVDSRISYHASFTSAGHWHRRWEGIVIMVVIIVIINVFTAQQYIELN